MKILVSGSSGLIGSALVSFFMTEGHEVGRLTRSKGASDKKGVFWDPATGKVDRAGLEGVEAIVHLAGRNIAARRWTAAHKRQVRDSRVIGTRLLCDALAQLKNPPRVLVVASAIGYYGSCGDVLLTEENSPGSDFLAEVCRRWEEATEPARAKGIRVVNLRIGVVLAREGGALAKMLLPFKLGLGGIIGNGRQYWSWIALDDVLRAILHCIGSESLTGPVNCTAPHPVTNYEFTRTLGRVLKRPTLFPLPAFVVRMVLGEMADALLLSSTRVNPKKLLESGYTFRYPHLEDTFRCILNRRT